MEIEICLQGTGQEARVPYQIWLLVGRYPFLFKRFNNQTSRTRESLRTHARTHAINHARTRTHSQTGSSFKGVIFLGTKLLPQHHKHKVKHWVIFFVSSQFLIFQEILDKFSEDNSANKCIIFCKLESLLDKEKLKVKSKVLYKLHFIDKDNTCSQVARFL